MNDPTPEFVAERYRGYLLFLAHTQWDEVLMGWGDPSDLVQQTLLEAIQERGSFTGKTTAAFAAWLRKILANNLADVIRGRRRGKRDYRLEQSIETALIESSNRARIDFSMDDPSPSNRAVISEELNLLADALTRLPADQMEAVTLHHLRGLSLEDTALQMRRTTASVAGLLRRGIKQLGSLMGAGVSNE